MSYSSLRSCGRVVASNSWKATPPGWARISRAVLGVGVVAEVGALVEEALAAGVHDDAERVALRVSWFVSSRFAPAGGRPASHATLWQLLQSPYGGRAGGQRAVEHLAGVGRRAAHLRALPALAQVARRAARGRPRSRPRRGRPTSAPTPPPVPRRRRPPRPAPSRTSSRTRTPYRTSTPAFAAAAVCCSISPFPPPTAAHREAAPEHVAPLRVGVGLPLVHQPVAQALAVQPGERVAALGDQHLGQRRGRCGPR